MTSIDDVAREAKVSVTTVSRVLSNSSHPVNGDTRARVLATAKALGFTPSAVARALATKETHIIGVIVGDASDPYFAMIVRGIIDEARAHGYLAIICDSNRSGDVEIEFVRLLRDYRADGVIFAGGGLKDPSYLTQLTDMLGWFKSHQKAIVALGHNLADVPEVTIDNRRATQEMTEYLLGLGHRRIAFLTGPSSITTSALRTEGYLQALATHGLSTRDALVLESDFTFESGQQLASDLLDLPVPPTAIFGSNDMVTLGCLVELKQRGISVPGQISLAGFDDIAATQMVDPALTTVRVPMRDLGTMGVRQLLGLINDEDIGSRLQLPHELVIRASTGPCRVP